MARAFFPRWTAWTRWLPTGSTGARLPLRRSDARLLAESGKSFDPKVVDILQTPLRSIWSSWPSQVGGRSDSQAFYRT